MVRLLFSSLYCLQKGAIFIDLSVVKRTKIN
ncbi:hypothetical protein FOPG_19879 [Fusarium oxysporum f. sp. conglutinans race 2 54008]|uniref:Uncharacterized protein n=1 Tax=Fusarium oxysporum f. sp. conglutinans race 2 54008 TaxID=1089457 RepID=X0GKM7_FUSOX|nr:hypothetical protein FOPG_19879 [Fusarium oxysporum f. sp. conglutinans race 2 54008]